MREGLYFESCGRTSLSLSRRGSFSIRAESGYTAFDGMAEDGAEYVTLTEYDTGTPGGLASALSREFGRFLDRVLAGVPRSVLVAGIGNGRVGADSLGPLAAERIAVGESAKGVRVFSFIPGVPEATGIQTEKLVPAVARLVGADLLVAVDSLAALSPARLCRAVQISGGARPGSAVAGNADAIREEAAGCPVVTVGVPTAVRGRLSRGEDAAE
ncbi:MAG: GPR endopeptidase, partial [Clostridia bacterium]|nr:GPR endopeptidase [Clostridia bacterium]